MKTDNQSNIPRPLNCFLLYRLEKQKEIVAKCFGANHRDISKIIAKWWKEASDEEKKYYREKSRIAKLEHSKIYPNYKYAPKKKTTPKRVYIRKSKKNQFTSRIEENNKLMEMIYKNPSALETITEETTLSTFKKSSTNEATRKTSKYAHMKKTVKQTTSENDLIMNYSNPIANQLSPGLSYTSSVSPQVGSFFDYDISSPYTVSTQLDTTMNTYPISYNYTNNTPFMNSYNAYDNLIYDSKDYFNFNSITTNTNTNTTINNESMVKNTQNLGYIRPFEPLFDFPQQQLNDDLLMMQINASINYIDPTLLHM
ncbi:uncharacterized protein BX663DRAFT_539461 [Cokeromyces recurvatus]|uniref:uncharacterized protein n=1 Tax=Cokeromyces recurvatus TaxID=90255 RepID=UPI00221F0DD4|nr:uncharacterized protein BX663DRAFT_539461 [Cokeromyces recurvatus]KAI7908114.1 hypothetical protein BX663DRAFT_539461 [Cokeromyces recurvatus]